MTRGWWPPHDVTNRVKSIFLQNEFSKNLEICKKEIVRFYEKEITYFWIQKKVQKLKVLNQYAIESYKLVF